MGEHVAEVPFARVTIAHGGDYATPPVSLPQRGVRSWTTDEAGRFSISDVVVNPARFRVAVWVSVQGKQRFRGVFWCSGVSKRPSDVTIVLPE